MSDNPNPLQPELKPKREFDHFSIVPFKAICGADRTGQSTSQSPERVKCVICWHGWKEWDASRNTRTVQAAGVEAPLIQVLQDCRRAIKSLANDDLGRDPQDGYYYQAELLGKIDSVLNANASAAGSGGVGQPAVAEKQFIVVDGKRREVVACPDGRPDCEVLHLAPESVTTQPAAASRGKGEEK